MVDKELLQKKIKLQTVMWNNIDTRCKEFTILNEKADKLLEVGNDSRDEWNYLFNEYSIAKFDLYE